MNKEWYKQGKYIAVSLLVFFPLGLFLMWKFTDWKPTTKKLITGLVFLVIIFGVIQDKTTPKQEIAPTPTPPTPTIKVEIKTINYETIKTWEIPNGGFGKVIVVSPQNFNESDMILLGEQLKNEHKKDRNSFIFIFDDKKAAELRDLITTTDINKFTTKDQDYYDKHYIGEYTKNGNSGYHQLVIYFDGVMGTNQKTIKY